MNNLFTVPLLKIPLYYSAVIFRTHKLPAKINIQALATLVVFILLSSGYIAIASASGYGETAVSSPLTVTVTVDVSSHKQAIHGFGASDAWSIQFVGKNWPIEKRERIANLLFSTSTDDDENPEGIGLSIWRFNIGAGSAAQGEASGISDEWRRAEGFLQNDLTYDWSEQAGQQWFLQAAKERGLETFIGFSNSPPVQLTQNGYAYGDGGTSSNLPKENYSDFAKFLGDVVTRFDEEGISFHSISPVNEPQWDWSRGNNQEGSPWLNHEIARLVEEIHYHFEEKNFSARIEIPEAAQINFLYEDGPAGRGSQLDYFWSDPETRVSDLQSVSPAVSAHSYYTTWPVSDMIRHRKTLRKKLDSMDSTPELWISEYCILENNEEVRGPGRDTGMDPALYMARVMHFDLTLAGASSWQWWLGVSPYNYNDGLVYIDHDKHDGEIHESKKLWVMGNFSRFIRPGAIRLETVTDDGRDEIEQAYNLMVSAYLNKDGTVAVVAVNYSESVKELALNLANVPSDLYDLSVYLTSRETDLELQAATHSDGPLTIPARSVATIVFK